VEQSQIDLEQLCILAEQPESFTKTTCAMGHKEQQELDSLMEHIKEMQEEQEKYMSMRFEWKSGELARLDSLWVSQERIMERRHTDGSVTVETYLQQFPDQGVVIMSPRIKTFRKTNAPGFISVAPSPHAQPEIPDMKSRILEGKIRKLNKRTLQLQNLIQRMAIEYEELPKGVASRISREYLQSTLRSSLADKDIMIPFEFAVYNPVNDSHPVPLRSDGFRDEYLPDVHTVSLFPNDIITKPDQLLVYFPGQKSQILKSLSVLLAGSLLFTLIIITSSGLSIFFMVRQKKISDIKSDFINNMTHEFKTPIATISIAADSINNPKVIQMPEMIKSYTRIIKEENSRMNSRVEQVLQMSLLDSKDFRFHLEKLDMQVLLQRSVENFSLIAGKRGGSVQTNFEAENPFVDADEGHMRNVLMNLLDNANKYSDGRPDVTVFTANQPGRFIFGVEDKGIGMTEDVKKKIFDKFFRLTTGNVHNIKGFGLGLSYVKAIVLAHGGDIRVTSEPGKGSRFEITLPLHREPMNHVSI
jgi:signal transduction histidine kinase